MCNTVRINDLKLFLCCTLLRIDFATWCQKWDGLNTRLRVPDTPAQAQAQAVQAGTSQIFVPPSNLPPPKALSFDGNLATTWKSWKQAWKRYEIATGVHKQEGVVRVSTLLSIIGEDGVKAHDTFTWNEGEDQNGIEFSFTEVRSVLCLQNTSYL